MISAIDIRWTLAPAPWPSSSPALALAIELLPIVERDIEADLIEILARTLGDRGEELLAVRSILAAALMRAHAQHIEIVRLRRRLAALLDARRQERTAAA